MKGIKKQDFPPYLGSQKKKRSEVTSFFVNPIHYLVSL